MRLQRVLLKVEICDDEFVRGAMVDCNLHGIEKLEVEEGTWDHTYFILDGILLDDSEKRKWLKENLHRRCWARITGDLKRMGPPAGMFERDTSSDRGEAHEVETLWVLAPIVFEVLSKHQLSQTTTPE